MSSAIPTPIQAKLPLVVSACQTSGVRRLWVFGSAARGEWREGTSDIDFLVELDPVSYTHLTLPTILRV